MSGYVKNTIGRDIQVTFPNGRTILVDPKDLEMNPNESVNEGKNSASWTSPKTGKSYDIQKNGNRWEMDIMKKGSSIYDKVTTIKRKTPQELKDWLDGYKIDSKWMEHLLKSVNEDATQLWSQTIDMLDKNLKKGYDPSKIRNVNLIAGTLQKLFKGLPQRNAMDMATSYNDYKAGQKDKNQTVKDWVRILKKHQIKESVNEASGNFVVYVEKDNGRKKLLHTKKSQRAANMFMSKNSDKILNSSGIRSIGSMSQDQWEKKEAQFAENIKKSDMKTVTKKEWDRTHKDFKGMIKGQPYMMWYDKQTHTTVYGPVQIKG